MEKFHNEDKRTGKEQAGSVSFSEFMKLIKIKLSVILGNAAAVLKDGGSFSYSHHILLASDFSETKKGY